MNGKKILVIVVVLIIITGLVGGIYMAVKYVSESADQINQEYNDDKTLLENSYSAFNTYISEYNDARIELSTLLDTAEYYEDFPKVNESITNFYIKYDELVHDITLTVEKLDTACKREYIETNLQEKCSTYQDIYEKIVNVYLIDIETYNQIITSYNTWSGKEEYQLFTSKYFSDYIDYNNDGIYEGKVITDEE